MKYKKYNRKFDNKWYTKLILLTKTTKLLLIDRMKICFTLKIMCLIGGKTSRLSVLLRLRKGQPGNRKHSNETFPLNMECHKAQF